MQAMDTQPSTSNTPPISFKSPSPPKSVLVDSNSSNIMSYDDDRPIKPAASNSNAWESIRQLDDEENWSERNCVISKQDHQLYSECAQEFVHDIIDRIPSTRTDYEELHDGNSMVDPPIHSYLPPPSPYAEQPTIPQAHSVGNSGPYNDDRDNPIPGGVVNEYEYMNEFNSNEEFNTNPNQFDMDYLERVSSNSNPAPTSALARESLYVKFDPLVDRHSPVHPAHRKALSQRKKNNMAGGDNLLMLDTPPHILPPTTNNYTTPDEPNGGDSTHIDPTTLLDLSANGEDFTPLPAHQQERSTDTHLTPTSRSVRGSSPHSRTLFDTSHDTQSERSTRSTPLVGTQTQREDELVKVLIYSESDLRKTVEQVRNECEIQNEETVALLKVDHAEDLAKQQKKIDRLVKEVQNLRAHVTAGRMDKVIGNEQSEDYEELCSQYRSTEDKLLEAYEELKMDAKRVEQERNQYLQDFASLERSFTDFHQRYNKSKELVNSLQKTVSELQGHNQKNETIIKKIKSQNAQLQEEIMIKLQEANETYEQIKKECASEVAVLKANAKKMNVQLASLERQLQQKEQEKAELTQICEDLMKELG